MENFNRICIIGLGLMGGSLALALKKKGYQGFIAGYDVAEDSAVEACRAGAIDLAAKNVAEAVTQAHLVVLATPLNHYAEILEEASPHLQPGAVITDLGSVKGYVETVFEQVLPQTVHFIGGHPMAGSEKDGFKAANPFLYENAYYFLTPAPTTPPDVCAKLEYLVKTLGAYPITIDAEIHDRIVSQISHLPHLVAAALVNILDRNKGISYLPFAGGGFRDTTRIASGNPLLWKDILLLNKKELLHSMSQLEEMLTEFKAALQNDDEEKILQNLKNAKLIRDSIPYHRKDYLLPLHEIFVGVEDRPGVLGELTNLLGKNHINIKEIEILHSRQEEMGAVRLGFASLEERDMAYSILKSNHSLPIYLEEKAL